MKYIKYTFLISTILYNFAAFAMDDTPLDNEARARLKLREHYQKRIENEFYKREENKKYYEWVINEEYCKNPELIECFKDILLVEDYKNADEKTKLAMGDYIENMCDYLDNKKRDEFNPITEAVRQAMSYDIYGGRSDYWSRESSDILKNISDAACSGKLTEDDIKDAIEQYASFKGRYFFSPMGNDPTYTAESVAIKHIKQGVLAKINKLLAKKDIDEKTCSDYTLKKFKKFVFFANKALNVFNEYQNKEGSNELKNKLWYLSLFCLSDLMSKDFT
jgi:hypothetical protein